MKTFQRINNMMQSIAKYLLVSMFILMLVLVIMQVLYRYVLHIPIPWAEELARYLFTWLIFLGASLTSANDEHLSIDVFQDMLPDKVKLYVQIVLDRSEERRVGKECRSRWTADYERIEKRTERGSGSRW